jgi:uncharacterized membrane protein YjfL (UPF0719 family)
VIGVIAIVAAKRLMHEITGHIKWQSWRTGGTAAGRMAQAGDFGFLR